MISGAAFCPQPPLLIPEIAGAAAAELDELRSACRAAVTEVSTPGHQIVLLGNGPVSRFHSPLARGSMGGFGMAGEVHLGAPTCGGSLELPPSLTVGAWLVRDVLGPRSGAVAFSVGPDFDSSTAAVELLRCAEESDVALIVMGDGSARRSTSAPGYLDERAADFDAAIATALAAGDAEALAGVDLELADELLVAGGPAWRTVGGLLAGGRYRAALTYDAAPYGVGYFVASWLTDD